ncbi:MAG: hypothetical protein HC819_08685 [Cyclobacteriaceae bacterium]|nr:hypothetical protein [Cyclobacteriaceae bacterium]
MNNCYTKYLPFVAAAIAILIVVRPSYGQATQAEQLVLHTSNSMYLCGETIWYSVHHANMEDEKNRSLVAYVNLHDKQGHLLIQQKVKLVQGRSHGSMHIPLAWKEDYYYLTCFTLWNLQFEQQELSCRKISIYNPFENVDTNYEPKNSLPTPTVSSSAGTVGIDMPDTTVHRRDTVNVTLSQNIGQMAVVSASIHSLGGLEADEYLFIKNQSAPLSSSPYYATEKPVNMERGLRVTGLAIDPATKKPVNSDILSLHQVGGDSFYRIASKNGEVCMDIQEFQGEAVLQLLNMNPYQSDAPDFEMKMPGQTLLGLDDTDVLLRNHAIDNYLKNARLLRKVIEIFDDPSTDSLSIMPTTKYPFDADKVYDMAKFQSMKTLEEFFREIVYNAELSPKEDKHTLRLKNMESGRFFMEKPWYLVDGYLTRHEDAVLQIPFKNLERVEIYNRDKSIISQLEPVMVRSGMIAIYTNNNYLKEHTANGKNVFAFSGFGEQSSFVVQHPHEDKTKAMENPKFGFQLQWLHSLVLGQENTISFVTSDLVGDYIIEIEGITSDGVALSGHHFFTVKY